MTLLSPLWLALLVPWAAACVWAGRGGGTAGVPFLFLWPTPPSKRGPRRRRPPGWALAMLLSSLAAILAAAGPAWTTDVASVTVVVDRTPSMTQARLRAAFDTLRLPASVRVRVVPVPGEAFETTAGAFDAKRVLPTAVVAPRTETGRPTAADNGNAVRRAAVCESAGVVLTDRAFDLPAGVRRVSPPTPLANAGIDRFAVVATDDGRGRAMVRVFNGSGRLRARLITQTANDPWSALPVLRGGVREGALPVGEGQHPVADALPNPPPRVRGRADQTRHPAITNACDVALPAGGTTQDYFLDLPPSGDAVMVTLLADDGSPWADDVPGDDTAFVARGASPMRVTPRTVVSDALGRMLAVYTRHRPAAAAAAEVTVVRGDPGDGPAVVLASETSASPETPAGGGAAVIVDPTHPASRSLTPPPFDGVGRAAIGPADDGWRVLVRAGDRPLLAVRETPARQAWVGFDADAWATSPAYVVFWADLLDWAGGGTPAWDASPCREGMTPVWAADPKLVASPGWYRDDAGRLVATAMDAVRPGPASFGAASGGGGGAGVNRAVVSASPVLLLAAVVLCGLGVVWRNLTES